MKQQGKLSAGDKQSSTWSSERDVENKTYIKRVRYK